MILNDVTGQSLTTPTSTILGNARGVSDRSALVIVDGRFSSEFDRAGKTLPLPETPIVLDVKKPVLVGVIRTRQKGDTVKSFVNVNHLNALSKIQHAFDQAGISEEDTSSVIQIEFNGPFAVKAIERTSTPICLARGFNGHKVVVTVKPRCNHEYGLKAVN